MITIIIIEVIIIIALINKIITTAATITIIIIIIKLNTLLIFQNQFEVAINILFFIVRSAFSREPPYP